MDCCWIFEGFAFLHQVWRVDDFMIMGYEKIMYDAWYRATDLTCREHAVLADRIGSIPAVCRLITGSMACHLGET